MTNRYPWNEGLTETEQQELLLISGNSKSEENENLLRCIAIIRFGLSPRTSASKKSCQRNYKDKMGDMNLKGFFGCITGRH